MQFGYARVVVNEVTPDMVGQELTIVESQSVNSVTLDEWNSNPEVTIDPLPGKCAVLIMCNVNGESHSKMYRSDTVMRVCLDQNNKLDAVIIGMVP